MSDFFVKPGETLEAEFENFPPNLAYPQIGWQLTTPDGATDIARNGAHLTQEPANSGRYFIRQPIDATHPQGDGYIITLDYNNGLLVPGTFRSGSVEFGVIPVSVVPTWPPYGDSLLADLRAAIVAAVTTGVPGLQCSAYPLGNPTPPCAQVASAAPSFDLAMGRGMDEWAVVLRVLVAENADIGAQVLLDRFVEPAGTHSIKQAVEVDRQLGGLVDDIRVVSAGGPVRYQPEGGGQLLGVDFQITVYAPGGTR